MAYDNVWNEVQPAGANPANTADDNIRQLKLDFRQRINSIIGVDQDTAFDRYKSDLQEEKQQKAITQMAPMAYQQAYDKYLATIGRSIG